jgi:acetyl esterase/lipase
MPSTVRAALDFLRIPERHRYGSHASQRADLYLPSGGGPHRVAVVIHGGSWRSRYGKAVMKPFCGELARRGLAAWNIEYRRVGDGGGWPMTFDDVAAAIDQLPEVASGRLDLDDVRLYGHSAGGHLALWAAGRKDSGVRFGRVLAAAAPSNLVVAGEAAHDLMGGRPEEVPERYAEGDPMQRLPLGIPVRLVHGAEDRTVPVKRSHRFAEAARAAGDEVELVEPSPGHHRIHLDPRSAAFEAAAEFLV